MQHSLRTASSAIVNSLFLLHILGPARATQTNLPPNLSIFPFAFPAVGAHLQQKVSCFAPSPKNFRGSCVKTSIDSMMWLQFASKNRTTFKTVFPSLELKGFACDSKPTVV